jgi:hypothetical protein
MKSTIVFLTFLITYVNGFTQSALIVNHIPLSYSRLTTGEITFENILFDSTLIVSSGYTKVAIFIVDSALLKGTQKKKYSENMLFTFQKNGKIIAGEYSISHPELKLGVGLEYTYIAPSLLFFHTTKGSTTAFPQVENSRLVCYNQQGKILYSKIWLPFSQKIPTSVNDTILENYNLENYKYDTTGGVIFSGQKLFMQTGEIVNTTSYNYSGNSGDSLLLNIISSLTGPTTSIDTTKAVMLRNAAGKTTDLFLYKRDHSTHQAWVYNNASQLISYSMDISGSYHNVFTIVRNNKGLPIQIIYTETIDSPLVVTKSNEHITQTTAGTNNTTLNTTTVFMNSQKPYRVVTYNFSWQ